MCANAKFVRVSVGLEFHLALICRFLAGLPSAGDERRELAVQPDSVCRCLYLLFCLFSSHLSGLKNSTASAGIIRDVLTSAWLNKQPSALLDRFSREKSE